MNMKPNILFILSDQHNAKILGHKGHPNVKTPNIDTMAEEGTRFDNAICQNPICTPSRMSWLSGQYCHNHGYYGNFGPQPKGLPTILGHFRKNGYTTAAIGKIHCPENWVKDECDFVIDMDGESVGTEESYTSYLTSKNIDTNMEDNVCLWEFGKKGMQSLDGRKSNLDFEDSFEGYFATQAIDFAQKAVSENKPFFIHLSFPRPHQCFSPSEPFWSMYDGLELFLPPNAEYEMKNKAPHLIEMKDFYKTMPWALIEPKTFEKARLRRLQGYLGAVSQVDHAIGILMDWLERNNIDDNTIIVYSSDHGDYCCEHGNMEKAPGICSDAITRVPFIWKWKDHIKPSNIVKSVVETIDFTTTICTLAGLPVMDTSDGSDITDMLYGMEGESDRIGLTECIFTKSIRKGSFRYVHYQKSMFSKQYPLGFGELYDLENDPWEMNNLYFDSKYKEVVNEIKQDLLDKIISSCRAATTLPFANIPYTFQTIKRGGAFINADGKFNNKYLNTQALTNLNYL